MIPALRDSAAHVFVDDLAVPVPDDADLHHLSHVLRLRGGESVSACDGAGRWRTCEWRDGTLRPTGEIVTTAAQAQHVGQMVKVGVAGHRHGEVVDEHVRGRVAQRGDHAADVAASNVTRTPT